VRDTQFNVLHNYPSRVSGELHDYEEASQAQSCCTRCVFAD
jgi:hypothetical protein